MSFPRNRSVSGIIEGKKMSYYKNEGDGYIQPAYSALSGSTHPKKDGADFSQALQTFLAQFPEFRSSPKHTEFLHYCFIHYISCDPNMRDLSLLEKLTQAGRLAKEFLGILSGKQS